MASKFKSLPWFGKVGLVAAWVFLFAPLFVLLALIFAPLLAFLIPLGYISELRVWLRMYRLGRFLRPRAARLRVSAEGGTLIVESPTLGWGTTRAWWTPDDILAQSPYSQPTLEDYKSHLESAAEEKCLDWDRWCFDNYTRLEQGRALLIPARSGRSVEAKFKKAFPQVAVVHTWTALAHPPQPVRVISSRSAWRRDRLALVACAMVVFLEVMLLVVGYAWLTGLFH